MQLVVAYLGRIFRACLVVLTAVVAAKYVATLNFQGDTYTLLSDVDRLLASVQRGKWSGWKGELALLQKLAAILVKSQGLSTDACLAVLAFINLAAFAGILWMSWNSLERLSRRSAIVFTAIVLSGPMLWYARSTFGEVLAAFCTMGLVVACWEQAKSWKIFFWFVAAGISKDTIFPFLFMLALLSTRVARKPGGDWTVLRSRLGLLSAACVTTVAVNVAFNYLRFSSPFNMAYLDPLYIVPRWSIQLSFFFGLLFSPNGGLLFFWPAFVLWLLLGGVCAVRSAVGQLRGLALIPWVTIVLVLLGLTLGLSKWFAPLGWVCWGPRLVLPALPALTYLLTVYYGSEMQLWLSKTLLRKRLAWFTGGALGLLALPNFVVLFKPDLMLSVFRDDAVCPHVAIIQNNAEYYYHCINHCLWTKRSVLLDAYAQASLHGDVLYALLGSLLLACLIGTASNRRSSPTPKLTRWAGSLEEQRKH